MAALLILALILAAVIALWVVAKIVGAIVGLLLMILLGGLIGAAAQSVVGYKGGFLFSIGAGLVGAVVGTIIANLLGAPKLLTLANLPILWTVVGSVAVVAAAKLVRPNESRTKISGVDSRLLR